MQVAGQSYKNPVFYVPGSPLCGPVLIDLAKRRADGVLVGSVGGESLEAIAKRYPGAELGERDTVVAETERRLISEPHEITRERFIEALEVLPPYDWQRLVYSESFKWVERFSGRITSVFVRIQDQYFEFKDRDCITHEEALEKVSRMISAKGRRDERA